MDRFDQLPGRGRSVRSLHHSKIIHAGKLQDPAAEHDRQLSVCPLVPEYAVCFRDQLHPVDFHHDRNGVRIVAPALQDAETVSESCLGAEHVPRIHEHDRRVLHPESLEPDRKPACFDFGLLRGFRAGLLHRQRIL
ncbi:hypothetical protein SDC9_177394 [bioreactor metagenome]|uniref:Uncharacterized protein n=1 Tax=bioreactor metagenome TaxID=1076179 RepID=A0A645GSQ0_9ZZZZ